MNTFFLKLVAITIAGCLIPPSPRSAASADDAVGRDAVELPPVDATFSHGLISPLDIEADGHASSEKNGVKFDVYFNKGRKSSAAIYVINCGRKQLVLTPLHHKAILQDLLRRQFTVIVADMANKKLVGTELEKYVVQLSADAQEAADGVLPRTDLSPAAASQSQAAVSKTETYANDYFTLMPGFTVERDVVWFRYGDIPEAFRQAIARQLEKPFNEADAAKANSYDIIYPAYGPNVGVLTNYGSNEKGRENFFALDTRYLVPAFAFKNLAIVHQQYFNDPVGGYPKGCHYYGDQFAVGFIRHLKGNAARYHLNPEKICCFGHSKGSEVPGMLVNKLRAAPNFLYGKVDFKKMHLTDREKTLASPYGSLPTHITCAILGSGVANNELRSDKMLPWNDEPSKNISPFFIFADHGELMRERTREVVAKAKAHGVIVETAELDSHTWPLGEAFNAASAFADRMLQLDYE
jgi:hypothetical protein